MQQESRAQNNRTERGQKVWHLILMGALLHLLLVLLQLLLLLLLVLVPLLLPLQKLLPLPVLGLPLLHLLLLLLLAHLAVCGGGGPRLHILQEGAPVLRLHTRVLRPGKVHLIIAAAGVCGGTPRPSCTACSQSQSTVGTNHRTAAGRNRVHICVLLLLIYYMLQQHDRQ